MTRRGRKITRSAVLFCAGLAGVTAETVYSLRFNQRPDSTLILAFLAMLGIPLYKRRDSNHHDDGDDTR